MEDIKSNIEKIRERIARAAEKSGRSEKDITLIAVTKLHDPAEMEEALASGVLDIGENKVQEIVRKYPLIKTPARWHLIGHLQTNKVKQIIDKVCLIHSVDSLHLAEEINKRSSAAGKTTDILIQVNAAGEEQKSGVSIAQFPGLLSDILRECDHIKVKGIMHMAPFAEDPEKVRVYFKMVKELYDGLKNIDHPRLVPQFLSMGMSGDFEVALEEGSNMVRIGTAIFGARDYSKSI